MLGKLEEDNITKKIDVNNRKRLILFLSINNNR